jgi:DNA-binding transcriptional LysR family regulator
MNDRIRELDVFLRVAEEASFSAAARSLNCNPSTISKQVQRLENRLGVRLFNRTSRALALTQEGERYLEAAQRVVEALEAAEAVVAAGQVEISGVLRINSTLSIVQSHIAPMIGGFLRRHPKLHLQFVLTAAPVDMLENQIDISLRSGHIPDSSLVAKRIASIRWIVCASPEYLKRAGTPLSVEDLARHNCLNFLPGSFRSTWPMRSGSKTVNLDVKGNVGANSADLLRLLALQGIGIVRLSEFHVGRDIADKRLVSLLREHQLDVEEPLFAVYASKRNLPPRVRAFLEFLDETLLARR